MNFRTTIILLIILLGVGAYVMFTSGGKGAAELKATDAHRLLDIASNDVSKVVITPADGKRIVLERNTLSTPAATIGPAVSDWKITEPVEAYADAMKVSDLIDAIVSATSTAQVDIGSSAADYGLDTPQFTVDLDAGPKSAKVDIGRAVKAGNELYVRVEGKDVAQVVGADMLDKLDTSAEKLRLAKLINADATTANWISIQRPVDRLELEKVAGQWQIALPTTRPTTMPAEQSVVNDLISSLGNAQAVEFGDASSNAALLIGQPQATVVISDQRPTTQPSSQIETVEFGSPDSLVGKNIWVKVTPPGMLATIPKETMDAVLKSSLDLRNREIVKIDPASVTQLRIVKNIPATTQPIAIPARLHEIVLARRPVIKTIAKAGPQRPSTHPATAPATEPTPPTPPTPPTVWQLIGTRVPADADDAKVDAALASFNPLRVDKFLPAAPSVENQTTYLLTITRKDGPPVQMAISNPGENSTDPPVGVCGEAIFNLPRSVITTLDADFAKAP